MKGNEARVVFFLHPADQLKDGQVSEVKPLRSSFVVTVLLLLGLLLGIGVLVFVLLQFGEQQGPWILDITTESPVTPVTSNQTRANHYTLETVDYRDSEDFWFRHKIAEIIQSGITFDTILCDTSK